MKWAKGIKPGDRARAKLRKSSGNDTEEYVAVEVRWVGHTKIGIKFGVEIIVSSFMYIARPDNSQPACILRDGP